MNMENKELKYYNVNIYCHEYFKNGVIEENVELYSTLEDLPDDVDDYVIETYGKEFFDEATKYGPLKFEINSTEEDLEEEAKIQQALEKMKKKYPNAYIPSYDEETGLPILPRSEYGDWEFEYDSLEEDLNRSNIKTLHDKLNKNIDVFYNMEMHSSFIDEKDATEKDKEVYREACKEFTDIESKIEAQGAYFDPEYMDETDINPTYFVYNVQESDIIDLAQRLFQEDILRLTFKKDGTFLAERINVKTERVVERGTKILTDINKSSFNGWTILDGMTFTFDIYGNGSKEEFRNLAEEENKGKPSNVVVSESKEDLDESADESELSLDDFLSKAEVILVDDAKSFSINDWEGELSQEIEEELEESTEGAKSSPKFLKYKLSDKEIKRVIDKLKSSEFSILDGKTSWKTKQFLKKRDLSIQDLTPILHNLEENDYKTNSKPAEDVEEYNEAIIFIKDAKVKDVGPFHLYIKLDYDSVEETPVIIISIHESGTIKKDKIGNLEEDIEKHDTLNPLLFEDNELKPDVKEAIEKIAKAFTDGLAEDDVKFTLKDIVLLGSNCSYNYTKDSDLDIHLIADSSDLHCPDELYPLLYSAYRSMFNKNYDITIKGIPAEIYVEMDKPQAKSNGIYSLNTGWIKEPVQQDIPDLDEEEFDKSFSEWEDKYFDLLSEIDEGSDKSEVTEKTA